MYYFNFRFKKYPYLCNQIQKSKNMKKMRLLAITMATMLTFGFVSCGNDDDIPYEGIELANGEFIEIEDFGTDTTASYKLHFKVRLENGNLVVEGLNTTSHLTQIPSTYILNTSARIADCGKVNGLNKLDAAPAEADLAAEQVAVEKHGYVVAAKGAANLDNLGNPTFHDPALQYMRIWLEEATDKGFKLRYEFPFTPVE